MSVISLSSLEKNVSAQIHEIVGSDIFGEIVYYTLLVAHLDLSLVACTHFPCFYVSAVTR